MLPVVGSKLLVSWTHPAKDVYPEYFRAEVVSVVSSLEGKSVVRWEEDDSESEVTLVSAHEVPDAKLGTAASTDASSYDDDRPYWCYASSLSDDAVVVSRRRSPRGVLCCCPG